MGQKNRHLRCIDPFLYTGTVSAVRKLNRPLPSYAAVRLCSGTTSTEISLSESLSRDQGYKFPGQLFSFIPIRPSQDHRSQHLFVDCPKLYSNMVQSQCRQADQILCHGG